MAAAARKFWDRCTRFVARFFVSDIVYPCQLKEPTVCRALFARFQQELRDTVQLLFGIPCPDASLLGFRPFLSSLPSIRVFPENRTRKKNRLLFCATLRATDRDALASVVRPAISAIDRVIIENTFAFKLAAHSKVEP